MEPIDILGKMPEGLTLEEKKNEKTGETAYALRSDREISVRDIVVGRFPFDYPKDAFLYAEGYQMLSQYTGTVETLECFTYLNDREHYRLRQTEGYKTVYNCLLVENAGFESYDLYAFSSCFRFNGRILINEREILLVLDLEGITVSAGQTLELEKVYVKKGGRRRKLFDTLACLLADNHKAPVYRPLPTGWCSWYCFGREVTGEKVTENLRVMKEKLPHLRYIQIDDGYQKWVGDWLTSMESYGDVRETIEKIHAEGFEPAIWVAPFAISGESEIFKTHPEYCIRDENGDPLCSDRITYGGWTDGPWYMPDCTREDTREWMKNIFSVMRNEWGVKYFKLDANVWGAIPGGVRSVRNSTSVDNYRLGMEAVCAGAGEDAVILGCNAPIWPSIGAVNAMRVSGDMVRGEKTIRSLRREIFRRSWMHNILWTNDPDVLTVEAPGLAPQTLEYQRCEIFASAGMLLIGDDMRSYRTEQFDLVKKFSPVFERAAEFEEDDRDLTCGHLSADGKDYYCLFWDDEEGTGEEKVFELAVGDRKAFDHWTDQPLAAENGVCRVPVLPHGGKVVRVE